MMGSNIQAGIAEFNDVEIRKEPNQERAFATHFGWRICRTFDTRFKVRTFCLLEMFTTRCS
jgi:hypothetical protein